MQSRDAYLDALGVTQWVLRTPPAPSVVAAVPVASAPAVAAPLAERPQWLLVDGLATDPAARLDAAFANESGQLMVAMLRAVQLTPQQVLLAPPGEALAQLMANARPRLVLALGEAAAQHLTGSSQSLDALRGSVRLCADGSTALVVSYHPAQLLRDASLKRKAWDDLKLALAHTPQDRSA
jgi:uracil-DNA glycosylase